MGMDVINQSFLMGISVNCVLARREL